MADELAFESVRQLGRRLRRREVSSEELVELLITRTERLDARLRSYITFTPERALEAARSADAELRGGRDRGPLHGIPVSIKDHIDAVGAPTTAGAKVLAGRVPAADAVVVARLREAGAIVMGKANMNQFAGGESGWNPDYGKIANPWFPEFSAGGSSGGSASQVAAGLVPLSVGSDNGGSIRIPAALCGVVGLKPTFGRVSTDGIAPRSFSTDHVGPLARGVDDVAIALGVIAGHSPGSLSTARRVVPNYADDAADVRGLRIGVDRDYSAVGEPAVRTAVDAALRTFESLGCSLRDVNLPDFDELFGIGDLIFQPEMAVWFDTFFQQHGQDMPGDVRALRGDWVGLGLAISAVDYLRANQRRRELQIGFGRAIRDVDLVALPTYFLARRPFPASADQAVGGYPEIGTYTPQVLDAFRYTLPFNLFGLPAITLPCGLDATGAVGLQIVGRAWDEPRVLRAARAYEAATTWHRIRPPLAG